MAMTLGQKIAAQRRTKGLTQEALAEMLGVSAQAVSKWENDLTCPDITLLPKLAQLLDTSIDALLSSEDIKPQTAILLPEEQRKPLDDMFFRIYVNSAEGDKVRVNLPMALVRVALEMGLEMPQISGNDALKSIDFTKLVEMVERGVIGKLVEVESADGDIVEIVVE